MLPPPPRCSFYGASLDFVAPRRLPRALPLLVARAPPPQRRACCSCGWSGCPPCIDRRAAHRLQQRERRHQLRRQLLPRGDRRPLVFSCVGGRGAGRDAACSVGWTPAARSSRLRAALLLRIVPVYRDARALDGLDARIRAVPFAGTRHQPPEAGVSSLTLAVATCAGVGGELHGSRSSTISRPGTWLTAARPDTNAV